MKRRVVACFLVGGLILGLCACGGRSGDSADAMPQYQPITKDETEAAAEAEPEIPCLKGYTTDEIMDAWMNHLLTLEDIQYNVANGDVSYDDYEELLRRMNSDEEFSIEMPTPEEATGSNALSVSWPEVDASELMTTYTIEFEDYDGYTIRETCQLSPIFRHEDREIMYGLWEALGEDAGYFPMEEDFYDKSYLLRDARDSASCNKLEYIIGTYMVENLTDGYSITPDNPRTYPGRLAARQVSAFDEEHDGNAATFFNWRHVIAVMYSSGVTYYDEEDAVNPEVRVSIAKMRADAWGPVHFVIALPNGATPNRPDGYRYDKIEMEFGPKAYVTDDAIFNLSYYE